MNFSFEFCRMFPMFLSLQSRLLAGHVGLQDLSLLALWPQMRRVSWRLKFNSWRYSILIWCYQELLLLATSIFCFILHSDFCFLLSKCRMPLRSSWYEYNGIHIRCDGPLWWWLEALTDGVVVPLGNLLLLIFVFLCFMFSCHALCESFWNHIYQNLQWMNDATNNGYNCV